MATLRDLLVIDTPEAPSFVVLNPTIAGQVLHATRPLSAGSRITPEDINEQLVSGATLPRGTTAWIASNDHAKINAYFGSREKWESIGDWSTFIPPQPDKEPRRLDHGFDESKDPSNWSTADMTGVAEFRGGKPLSRTMASGDIATPLTWQCDSGHTFRGSPRLILTAGHWCPECVKNPA